MIQPCGHRRQPPLVPSFSCAQDKPACAACYYPYLYPSYPPAPPLPPPARRGKGGELALEASMCAPRRKKPANCPLLRRIWPLSCRVPPPRVRHTITHMSATADDLRGGELVIHPVTRAAASRPLPSPATAGRRFLPRRIPLPSPGGRGEGIFWPSTDSTRGSGGGERSRHSAPRVWPRSRAILSHRAARPPEIRVVACRVRGGGRGWGLQIDIPSPHRT
jgi:hypothetical protein